MPQNPNLQNNDPDLYAPKHKPLSPNPNFYAPKH
jgi:hypothetical protein